MISRAVLVLLQARSEGLCEVCGRYPAANTHHRKPRGMGGSKDPAINQPSNLLRLCGSGTTGCHGVIESSRATAYRFGLLVHRWDHPAEVPVKLLTGWYLLDDEGGVRPSDSPEPPGR